MRAAPSSRGVWGVESRSHRVPPRNRGQNVTTGRLAASFDRNSAQNAASHPFTRRFAQHRHATTPHAARKPPTRHRHLPLTTPPPADQPTADQPTSRPLDRPTAPADRPIAPAGRPTSRPADQPTAPSRPADSAEPTSRQRARDFQSTVQPTATPRNCQIVTPLKQHTLAQHRRVHQPTPSRPANSAEPRPVSIIIFYRQQAPKTP